MAEIKNSQVVSGIGDQNNTNPLDYPNGMQDPANTSVEEDGSFRGGRTKVNPTDMSGESGRPTGAYSTESLPSQMEGTSGKIAYNGMAPNGENSSGIPAAQAVDPITFGDPNNTAVDFKENHMPSGENYTKRGFNTPV